MTDLDHALQTYELSLIYFVASEKFGVVAKVAQEPVQLSQGFRGAIEPAGKDVAREPAGFQNGQSQGVVGLLGLPLKPDLLHPTRKTPSGTLSEAQRSAACRPVIWRFTRRLLSGRDNC